MRITTRIAWDVDGRVVEHEWHEYSGPIEKLDRAASNAAKSAASNASNVASTEEGNANAAQATLAPFYRQEMQTQHGFDPAQTNELLNYAEQGAGGANSGIVGQGNSEAARTRNTSGFSSALDQASRDRQKAMSNASLGVGMADVQGAKQLNQEGAAGLSGLYGTDSSAMLKAMGLQNEDINTEINAGKSGWFQNTIAAINALKPGVSGGGGQGTSYSVGS